MAIPKSLLERCPSCWLNFAQLYCQMTCSENQAHFLKVTETINSTVTDKSSNESNQTQIAVEKIDFNLTSLYASGFYNSCKDVYEPSMTNKAMVILCGSEDCDPVRLLEHLGQKDPSPFEINFRLFSTTPTDKVKSVLDINSFRCSQAPDNLFPNSCSCTDCPEVCPLPPPIIHFFTIFGINGWFILMPICYCIIVVLIIYVFMGYHRKHKNEGNLLLSFC